MLSDIFSRQHSQALRFSLIIPDRTPFFNLMRVVFARPRTQSMENQLTSGSLPDSPLTLPPPRGYSVTTKEGRWHESGARFHIPLGDLRRHGRNLLREYVEVRLRIVRDLKTYGDKGIARSEELHGLLWAQVVDLGRDDDRSVVVGLFIQSLNQVIDIHTKRVAAGLVHRIPEVIWITLFFVGILGTTVIGYRAGLSGTRGIPATLALILAFSAVMILIMDLDRPGQSMFQVSQQSMAKLLENMD